jgi:hypothetical protein
LFGYCESIIDVDAKASGGAFDFLVAEQKQYGPSVAFSPIDQRSAMQWRKFSPRRNV